MHFVDFVHRRVKRFFGGWEWLWENTGLLMLGGEGLLRNMYIFAKNLYKCIEEGGNDNQTQCLYACTSPTLDLTAQGGGGLILQSYRGGRDKGSNVSPPPPHWVHPCLYNMANSANKTFLNYLKFQGDS